MKKLLYSILIVISLVLFVLAFTAFADTQWLGGVAVGVGIYLFLGTLIKLCKTNDKFKGTFLCALDLLFWLP